MSFVLRKLDRRAAFHSVDWVRSGDVAGDALCNLRTQGNALSVWLIDDSRTNLERIIAAVAAGRMKLDKLDYALIGPERLEELGICITQEKGASGDDDANALWHQDLRNLSGTKLVELAVLMQTHSEFKRVHKKEVGRLIAASIQGGFIDPSRLDDRLRKELPPATA